MAVENCTVFTDFILLGLSGRQDVQQGLFVLFLLVYGITVITNLGMILLINMDPQLHTPMYYFLSNLSFCDVCYSSSVSPKMLADFLSQQKKIAYNLCAVQMFVFGTFVDVECVMLSVMAYDYYVAICNPLLYTTAMSGRVCSHLVAIVYIQSLVYSAIFTYCTIRLSFCNSNVINHFFCDFPPFLALSTSDRTINEIAMFTYIGCVLGFSIVSLLLSYSYIGTLIFRMKSAKGTQSLLYLCLPFNHCGYVLWDTHVHVFPTQLKSLHGHKVASVFYIVVPLIYTLRNNDVKGALKKAVGTKLCSL